MTLNQITIRVGEKGVKSPTLDSDFKDFINEAMREVADRRLWTFMHNRTTATIASGQTSVPLGATFKQLGQEESPISFDYGNYSLPVRVVSRERIEQAGIWPWQNGPFNLSIPGGYMPTLVVFLEKNGPGGQWTLNVPPQYQVTQNAVFNISGFYYPTPLALGDDHNAFTDDSNLAQAIINIAKELAYTAEESDNPKAQFARALAEKAIERALYADGQAQYSGRTMRL